MSSIKTHNGTFTVLSTKTGNSRTFRIKTQKSDAKFAPGSRIISLLCGPNNESDYTGFGFVNPDGKIQVWRSKQSPVFVQFAKMMEKMESHIESGKIEVMAATKCRKCNRKLTTVESVTSGIGPDCATREF